MADHVICPVCSRLTSIRKDGTMRKHIPEPAAGRVVRPICPGSYKTAVHGDPSLEQDRT